MVTLTKPVAIGAWDERRSAGPWANAARGLVALYFLGSAVFNAVVTYPKARTTFRDFEGLSWPGFDLLVRELAIPLAHPITAMVIAFELTTGILLLGRGRLVRAGLFVAVVWHLALIPFLSFYAIVNLVLAAAIARLLRYDFPHSIGRR
jgi:hypothetical protein